MNLAKQLKNKGKNILQSLKGALRKAGKSTKPGAKDISIVISKVTNDTPGGVILGELDEFGRTTGMIATIKQEMIKTGSPASSSIRPPGFMGSGPGSPGHARGHLLGNQLGGPSYDARNIVALFQNPANTPLMRNFENSVRAAVESGQVVRYQVVPIYKESDPIPL